MRIQRELKKVKLSCLFEVDLKNLIPQVSCDNPAQIYPVPAAHDTIPVKTLVVRVSSLTLEYAT